MISYGLTTAARIEIMALLAFGLWVLAATAVATYGSHRGFQPWPLFVCSVFLGFPLVLLAVTIGSGLRQQPRPV